MTTNSIVTTWKVWLRSPSGKTETIEIQNAVSELDAKIKGVDKYDHVGWYALKARLIGSSKSE